METSKLKIRNDKNAMYHGRIKRLCKRQKYGLVETLSIALANDTTTVTMNVTITAYFDFNQMRCTPNEKKYLRVGDLMKFRVVKEYGKYKAYDVMKENKQISQPAVVNHTNSKPKLSKIDILNRLGSRRRRLIKYQKRLARRVLKVKKKLKTADQVVHHEQPRVDSILPMLSILSLDPTQDALSNRTMSVPPSRPTPRRDYAKSATLSSHSRYYSHTTDEIIPPPEPLVYNPYATPYHSTGTEAFSTNRDHITTNGMHQVTNDTLYASHNGSIPPYPVAMQPPTQQQQQTTYCMNPDSSPYLPIVYPPVPSITSSNMLPTYNPTAPSPYMIHPASYYTAQYYPFSPALFSPSIQNINNEDYY